MQLINSFSRAGAELVAAGIAAGLPETRRRLICAVGGADPEEEGRVRRDLESRGIVTLSLGKPAGKSALRAVARLRRILAAERVSLLHTHCESPDTLGRLACMGLPVIHVTTLHNFRPWPGRERLGRLVERLLRGRTRAFVACAPGMEPVARSLGYPEGRFLAIPNGIDAARFRPSPEARRAWRERLAVPEGRPLLVSVGRVSRQKGHDVLIEALAELARRGREPHLAIAGSTSAEPRHAESVRAAVRDKGLEARVSLLGPVADIPSLLAAADLIVMPSRWEGLSLALLEALASGSPVVATDIPANRGLLPGLPGDWLVPPEDVSALAAAMEAVLSDPGAAAERGAKARERVAEGFSERVMLRSYADLYDRLLPPD